MRSGKVERKSKETEIFCEVVFKEGEIEVDVEIPFLAHMLELMFKFARISAKIKAKGDVEIDIHHLNEDLGIVLGQALSEALGDKVGIRRVGFAYVPMDEALSRVVIDLSGRPYLVFNVFPYQLENEIKDYTVEYARQFFLALANHLKANIHIDLLRAKDFHHAMESVFKGFGLALSGASEIVGRGVSSTKGLLD